MTYKTITIAAVLAAAAFMPNGGAQAAGRHHGWHPHASMARHGEREHRRYVRHVGHFFRHATVQAPRVAGIGGIQEGRASFYAGGRTANGSFVGAATCAHRSLPFGTKVLVTNLANARQAILTVNDRGPFVRGRVLDVSRGAAGLLGMLHAGVSQIRMQVLGGAG